MKKGVLNSPRLLELKKEKNKILRRKIFFLVLLFTLMLVGLSFLSKWENLNINNIQISGNKVVETKMIEEMVKEKISGDYLGIFPKTNFIIYPQRQIKKELKNKFKRIKEVSVNDRDIKTLEIFISEYEAKYLWCGNALPEEVQRNDLNSSKCYFLDQDGYIFDEAPYFSGEVYLKFYGATDTEPIGSYFFQPIFKKMISFEETLGKIGIKPVIFYIKEDGDIRMFLSSSTSQMGPEIIFKTDSDFEKVLENLQSVLTTEPLQSDFKNKYSSLLYIDLRFGNKVYYKFR